MKSIILKNAKFIASSSSICTALLSCQIGLCRICMEETDNRRLLRPCKCKGTQAFVHQICLETWLKHKNDKVCETCNNEYKLRYIGLKNFDEWTSPRPLNDQWEDHADFVCGFIWTLILCRIIHYLLSNGIFAFQQQLFNMLGTKNMVSLWWLAFIINSVYYGSVVTDIFQNWIEANSEYEWKDFTSSTRTSSSDLSSDDLLNHSLTSNF